jgi:hypothetical protein
MSDKVLDIDVYILSVPHTTILYCQGLKKKKIKMMNDLLLVYGSPLLTQSVLNFIVNTIRQHNILNYGMSHKDIIGLFKV